MKPHPDVDVGGILTPIPNITSYCCFYFDQNTYTRGASTYSKMTVKMAYGIGQGKVTV